MNAILPKASHEPNLSHTGGSGPLDGLLSFSLWDISVVLLLYAAFTGYALMSRWLYFRGKGSHWRTDLAFATGLAALFLALGSPMVFFVRQGSHLAFMAQLELLVNVAPPLLLLGMSPLFSMPIFSRARAFLGRAIIPTLTLGAWMVVLFSWHLPSLQASSMQGQGLYVVQIFSFVAAGVLFWLPVIGPALGAAGMGLAGRLGYLALAQAGAGLLAAMLVWSPESFHGIQHGAASLPWGLSESMDRKLSGVLMMTVDMVVASAVAGWIFFKALTDAGRPPAYEVRRVGSQLPAKLAAREDG